MLFNSLHFALFFPVVTAMFFALPPRGRWLLLLVASTYFYMVFQPVYVLILVFTIAVDYVAGLLIEPASGRARKAWLVASIAANLLVLAVFKYWNFAAGEVGRLSAWLGTPASMPLLEIALPIGLSFHTFQSMSYTFEVYRGAQRAERHLGIFALYVLFYPQLVAGPIERPQNLLSQFHSVQRFSAENLVEGLRLMLWGLFKKVVIADRLAEVVNPVFGDPVAWPGVASLLAIYFFTFQIYCDFSGYSDIARGAARVMGYELMINFRRPYLATSMSDFWRRWHISLSTWFRDYVYIPLGGNRVSPWLRARNLLVVFLLSGLWHGANWTYLVWGAIHGILVAAGSLRSGSEETPTESKWVRFGRGALTFHLVALAWVFFRAESVGRASQLLSGLLRSSFALPVGRISVLGGAALIAALWTYEALEERGFTHRLLAATPWWARWGLYYAGVFAVAFLGAAETGQFIYFQF
jgi:alginate O-acetyltransferase complex protein AlgI